MAYLPNSPKWIKITKSFTDFSAAGLTNDIEIFSLPAGGVVHSAIMKHTTAFTGGTIATYTVSVGITGNLVKYGAVFNVKQAVGSTTFGLGTSIVPTVEDFGAVTSVRAAATSTVGLLNAASAGSMDFYLLISTLI